MFFFQLWHSGADLGGGGRPFPSGIRPPADPKGPPFDTFSEIPFWPTDPKIFLKAPLAPIYTNFEGERAPKKRYFLSKFFKKCPKTAFLTFFSKNCLRRRKLCQNRGKTVLWESSKNQFGRPKKKKRSSKFWKIFWKSAPPRENPRSAPDDTFFWWIFVFFFSYNFALPAYSSVLPVVIEDRQCAQAFRNYCCDTDWCFDPTTFNDTSSSSFNKQCINIMRRENIAAWENTKFCLFPAR